MDEKNGNPTEALATIDRGPSRQQLLREGIGRAEPMAIVPRTFAEAQTMAEALSKSSLINAALKERAPDVLMIMMAGSEMGFPPISAMRLFYVNPKTGTAHLMSAGVAAAVRKSSVCRFLRPDKGNDDKSATWHTQRGDEEPVSLTYTLEQARSAGLLSKDNWKSYPARMLSARARKWLCDDVYPEITAGVRDDDEDDDFTPAPFVAVSTTPTAPPATKKKSDPPARKPADPVIDVEATEKTEPSNVTPIRGDIVTETTVPPTKAQQEKKAQQDREAKAREEALAKARDNAKYLEEQRNARPQPAVQQDIGKTNVDPSPDIRPSPAGDDFGDEESAPDVGPLNIELVMHTDGKPYAQALDGHDAAANFARFKREVDALTKETWERGNLEIKNRWVPWSRPMACGKDFAGSMREAFSNKKSDLGL